MTKVFLIALIGLIAFTSVFAHEPQENKLAVFVEGDVVDFNYIRNNTPFIDFVNEPHVADVHVIVSRQGTGSGGRRFALAFYNKTIPAMTDFNLTCNTFSFDTQEIIRQKFLATLQAGLLPFMNEKSGVSNLVINSKTDDTESKSPVVPVNDPWKNWVFRIGSEGGLSGEEQRKNYDYDIVLQAKKVTKKWKINTSYDYERSETRISKINDGNTTIIKRLQYEQDAALRAVFSINQHWSYGIFLQGTQNTYRNNKMSLEVVPALEYNYYPWEELDRRSLTFSYYIGPVYNKYYETTVLGKTSELLWNHKLNINLFRVETWGESQVWLEGSQYFSHSDLYSLKAGLDLSFRISKGLSFTVEFETQSVQDQIYLPASELSDEELLLNTRKLPTTFEYGTNVGIRFQFGSIYNNVVNERL